MKKIGQNHSKKKLTTVLNDLKSAFDNVPHDILFKKKLPNFGIDTELINTIEWMYP